MTKEKRNGDATKEDPTRELAGVVAGNLSRLRASRGHTLAALAKLAGVSRAMLNQIELGRSMPTIGLLWKVARALDVPFAALMSDAATGGTVVLKGGMTKILTSADGSFTSRALFPFEGERRVEFYKLTLAPHATEKAEPHAPGTMENLTVAKGEIEIGLGAEHHLLGPEDAILFQADLPHSYRNLSSETAVMYLVMTYVDEIG